VLCCLLFVLGLVSSTFFSTKPRGWLGRTSPKWFVLCREGRKTLIIRSTLWQSRPNTADLKCLSVHLCVCTHVRTSIRTYVHSSTKGFFDFNEIWHVGIGRWVMHDGTVGAGNWPQIRKLGHNIWIWSGRVFDIWPSFCVTWLWSWHKRQLQRVDRQSSHGANFSVWFSFRFRFCVFV